MNAKIRIEERLFYYFGEREGIRLGSEVASNYIVVDFDWTDQIYLVFWEGFDYHCFNSVKYHLWPIDFGAREVPKADQLIV